jgi:hypothetical protein
MRATLIFAALFFTTLCVNAQTDTKENKICSERGHVLTGTFSETLMNCPINYEDRDSVTVVIISSCNIKTYVCARCGKSVAIRDKQQESVVWSVGDKKRDVVFFPSVGQKEFEVY